MTDLLGYCLTLVRKNWQIFIDATSKVLKKHKCVASLVISNIAKKISLNVCILWLHYPVSLMNLLSTWWLKWMYLSSKLISSNFKLSVSTPLTTKWASVLSKIMKKVYDAEPKWIVGQIECCSIFILPQLLMMLICAGEHIQTNHLNITTDKTTPNQALVQLHWPI